MPTPIAGVKSWVKYGWETTFGQTATTIDKSFGHGVRITTLTRRNNLERVFALGARNAQKLLVRKFEGVKTIEFQLANPWFFKAVMGTVTTTGSGPYTHTFSESDVLPSITIENDIATDTPSVAKLLGAKVATCVLTATVGEAVRVRLDVPYVNEIFSSTTSSPVAETFEIMTFAQGTLEMPMGTTVGLVQNVEVTIANNGEILWALGSRFGQQNVAKQREYTIRMSVAFQDSATILQKFYGGTSGPVTSPAETATLNLIFDNGLTGTNQRQVKLAFTGIQFDEESLAQDPTAVILEDAVAFARNLTLTAITNTSTPP